MPSLRLSRGAPAVLRDGAWVHPRETVLTLEEAASIAALRPRPAPASGPSVYADNNSTTHAGDAALRAAHEAHGCGNPSNLHHSGGRRAAQIVAEARSSVARRLDVPPDAIRFTSGGTESNNTAVHMLAEAAERGRRHVLVSAVEHKCMLLSTARLRERGFEVEEIPVHGDGRLDLEALRAALRADTAFVSVMAVNNETGCVQPVRRAARIVREAAPHAFFLSDCAQALGKYRVRPLELGVDVLTASAHKFHGLPGVGILYLGPRVPRTPLLLGGPQEGGDRAGTENVPGIAACAAALRATWDEGDEERAVRNARLASVRDAARSVLLSDPAVNFAQIGCGDAPHVLLCSFGVHGLCNAKLLAFLDAHGVEASVGSACNTSSERASHVLRAMGAPPHVLASAVRLSFCDATTREEAERCAAVLAAAVRDQLPAVRVRRSAGATRARSGSL